MENKGLTNQVIAEFERDPNFNRREFAERIGCSRRNVRGIIARYKVGRTAPSEAAKILIFDIETSPMEIYVWGLFKQRPTIQQVIKDWSILTWSAKWLFNDEVMSERVTGEQAIGRDDSSVVPMLWTLLDEADMVVGHNAAKFDVRKANWRFALNGLKPPSPYRVIDTMLHSMKVFGTASYKLDWLAKSYGIQMKDHAPYEWWKEAVTGSDRAIADMESYNRTDVNVTEELYLKLRPWMKGHPNVGLYIDTDGPVCTNCGNSELNWGGHYFTPAGKFKSFRCENPSCGAIGRSRISALSTEDRKKLILAIAT